jgi:hypothetical protein
MRTRTASLVVATSFVAFAFSTPAPAATAYTNLASFLGALTNSYTENFSGITNTSNGVTAAPQNFSGNGMSLSASPQPASDELWIVVNGGTKWLSVRDSSNSLVFNLTSGNITAVGGNFFTTDLPGNFIEGSIDILFSDSTSTNWAPSSASDFIGFVFDTPVTSMTLSPVASEQWVTAGSITIGQVPEPSTMALLFMTCAGALWWARRRLGSKQ